MASIDIRDMTKDGKPPERRPGQHDYRWWLKDGKACADAITSTLEVLANTQNVRRSQNVVSARLYGNLPPVGPSGLSFSRVAASNPGLKDRVTENVVQTNIDAITARITKNKPKPLFLTSGGDYKMQRRAKKLTKFVEGVWYETKTTQMAPTAFRDAAVWSDGLVHVYERNDRVAHDRVLPDEIWVDELEGLYGCPRSLHYCKTVDRDLLAATFPEHKAEINSASLTGVGDMVTTPTVSDLVIVRESWRLPTGPESEDGRHVISIDGVVLNPDETEWEHEFFPFARMPWCQRLYGWWSQGLAEQIQNIQLSINTLNWVIQQSIHLMGSWKVLIETGSKIVKSHIDNAIGAIITYQGIKPEYITPPMIQAELFQQLERLKAAAQEKSHISALSVNGQKPAGLNSGEAQRVYDDLQNDGFTVLSKQYEDFHMELARLDIATAKDIAKRSGKRSYSVRYPGKQFVESISWSDVDLDEDEYVMKCFPISSLPSDPAGRTQTIQEWAQAGWITQRQAKRLADFPDLEAAEGLANAQEDRITQILDAIVDEGEMTPPEPHHDLALAKEMALEYLVRGESQDLEPERLEMLRVFMGQVDSLLTPPVDPAMAAAGAPPGGLGAPQAAAAPPPVSDLIPNVPQAAPPPIQ